MKKGIVFIGLIQHTGHVAAIQAENAGGMHRLAVSMPEIAGEARIEEGSAVNGVCLTVETVGPESVEFNAMQKTLRRSLLEDLAEGAP